MKAYETSATVEEQGRVLVAGVPFEPGTRVEVTITPIPDGRASLSATEPGRAERLLAALDKARKHSPPSPRPMTRATFLTTKASRREQR